MKKVAQVASLVWSYVFPAFVNNNLNAVLLKIMCWSYIGSYEILQESWKRRNWYFLSSNADNKGVSDILEADAKQIATMACETFEKYVLFVFLYLKF